MPSSHIMVEHGVCCCQPMTSTEGQKRYSALVKNFIPNPSSKNPQHLSPLGNSEKGECPFTFKDFGSEISAMYVADLSYT